MAIKSPTIKDFPRGDSRTVNIQVLEPDGVTPFDLTGSKVYFTVNASSNNTADTDASAAIALNTSVFANPQSGIATLQITSALTQDMAPGTYYYDVQVRDSSGNISSMPQGQFIVIADVTRTNT